MNLDIIAESATKKGEGGLFLRLGVVSKNLIKSNYVPLTACSDCYGPREEGDVSIEVWEPEEHEDPEYWEDHDGLNLPDDYEPEDAKGTNYIH
ncbi:MAG TPA: hypothetical protein VJI46_06685 [Candidatus Nanoarchaeia archaeon]|nr:hypothetical protein [Candidatus Nanoarchaeia archaeon]